MCGLRVDECGGVLSESRAQQNKPHSGFPHRALMIRFSKAFSKDNTCEDKPLHGEACAARQRCARARPSFVGVGGGKSYTSPGEHVMLLSRPQTPPQSTEEMKADASFLPFLSRLFPFSIKLLLYAS